MAGFKDDIIAKLLRRIATKADSVAMEQLFCVVADDVKIFARKYLYEFDLAEDVLSQVFVAIAAREEKTPPNEPLAWILGMAKYVCFDFNRKAIKQHKTIDIAKIENFIAESTVANLEILNELDRLSELEQRVVYFRFWGKLSLREIANQMSMSRHGTEKILTGALDKLRECFNA